MSRESQAAASAVRKQRRKDAARENELEKLLTTVNSQEASFQEELTQARLEGSLNPSADDDDEQDDSQHGPIYDWMKAESRRFPSLCGFEEDHLLTIWRRIEPLIGRRRGKKPSISLIESLCCYLMWIRTGLNFEKLATILQYPTSTLRDAIDRIRPYLYESLKDSWSSTNFRPKPLESAQFRDVSLCIDSTSMEVHRPKAPFNEAKIYFDEIDRDAYRLFLEKRMEKADERHAKKRANYVKYAEKKRRRIEQLQEEAEAQNS